MDSWIACIPQPLQNSVHFRMRCPFLAFPYALTAEQEKLLWLIYCPHVENAVSLLFYYFLFFLEMKQELFMSWSLQLCLVLFITAFVPKAKAEYLRPFGKSRTDCVLRQTNYQTELDSYMLCFHSLADNTDRHSQCSFQTELKDRFLMYSASQHQRADSFPQQRVRNSALNCVSEDRNLKCLHKPWSAADWYYRKHCCALSLPAFQAETDSPVFPWCENTYWFILATSEGNPNNSGRSKVMFVGRRNIFSKNICCCWEKK